MSKKITKLEYILLQYDISVISARSTSQYIKLFISQEQILFFMVTPLRPSRLIRSLRSSETRQEIKTSKTDRQTDRQAEETALAADQTHLPSLSSSQLYHGSRGGSGGRTRRSKNPRQESVFLVHRGSDAVRAGRGPHSPGPARRALQKTRQWFTERPSRALAFISVTKSATAWGRTGGRAGTCIICV